MRQTRQEAAGCSTTPYGVRLPVQDRRYGRGRDRRAQHGIRVAKRAPGDARYVELKGWTGFVAWFTPVSGQ